MLQRADVSVQSCLNWRSRWIGFAAPWAVGLALTGVVSSARPALAQSGAGERALEFSIPSQSLAAAIEAYSAATGLQVFYDGHVASDRRSTAVSGVLAPDVALRILLEGTNLEAVYAGSVFAVVPAARDGRARSGPGSPGYQPYFATIQHSIEQAFCRNPQTAPGDYRIALRFRIGFSGEVLLPELLHSTGDAQRDDVIVGLLRGLSLAEPPPPNLPQPVTMLISPRPRAQSGDCNSAGTAASSPQGGP